jgi:hypothetical protein
MFMTMKRLLEEHQLADSKTQDELLALCCTVGVQEAHFGDRLSSFALTVLSQRANSGQFVAAGGVDRLARRWTACVTAAGGVVVRDVLVSPIDLEPLSSSISSPSSIAAAAASSSSSSWRARGVQVSDGHGSKVTLHCALSVVSGLGVLPSSLSLLPRHCLSTRTKQQLSALRETRPKIRTVFWLAGSPDELRLSSTDYFEIAQHSPLAALVDTIDAHALRQREELLHGSFVHLWSPSAQGLIHS